MNDFLIVCSDFQYTIDFNFYEKNNFNHLKFNDLNDYEFLIKNFNFENFKNIVIILDDVMFDSICKTANPFNTDLHHSLGLNEIEDETFYKNFNTFFEKFPQNVKIVVYDNGIEIPQKYIVKFILKWMEMRDNNYFISSRFDSIVHNNSITGLVYLPIIFSFYLLNFNRYEKLDYSFPSNPKYNFISYLGNSENVDKINYRFVFLKALLKDKINELKHEKDSIKKIGLKYLMQHKGEGHYWNLLDVLSAKIQLIFETIHPTVKYHDEYYFSEKTMKLFLLPHPYFLLVHGTALEKLEKFGFKFSEKCFSHYDFIKTLEMLTNDIDGWIEKNNNIFKSNQENLYKIVDSTTLNHHIFLEKIIII